MSGQEGARGVPASRVQGALRLVGAGIVFIQGAVLPLLNYLTDDDVDISLPAITAGLTLAGVASIARYEQRRKEDSS